MKKIIAYGVVLFALIGPCVYVTIAGWNEINMPLMWGFLTLATIYTGFASYLIIDSHFQVVRNRRDYFKGAIGYLMVAAPIAWGLYEAYLAWGIGDVIKLVSSVSVFLLIGWAVIYLLDQECM